MADPTVTVADVYTSCGTLTVASGSALPLRWINSTSCGVDSSGTLVPALFVSDRPFRATPKCTNWSLAVLEATTVTCVFSPGTGPPPDPGVEPPPHPASKRTAQARKAELEYIRRPDVAVEVLVKIANCMSYPNLKSTRWEGPAPCSQSHRLAIADDWGKVAVGR